MTFTNSLIIENCTVPRAVINAVGMNLQDKGLVGIAEDADLVICDSPGFGDTEGVEVDIANGIGVSC